MLHSTPAPSEIKATEMLLMKKNMDFVYIWAEIYKFFIWDCIPQVVYLDCIPVCSI